MSANIAASYHNVAAASSCGGGEGSGAVVSNPRLKFVKSLSALSHFKQRHRDNNRARRGASLPARGAAQGVAI